MKNLKVVCIKAVLSFLILIAPFFVRADVIVDNLNQPTDNYYGPIGDDSNSNDFFIGQQFTLPSGPNPYQLSEVTLLLNAIDGGANITVSIWSVDSNNNPLNQIAVVSSQPVINAGPANFFPSTNITLSPGIYYVVATPTTPADSGFVGWAYTTSTNWTGTGSLDSYADTAGGGWQNYSITNFPYQLSIQAAQVTPTIGISRQGGVETVSWPSALNGYVLESTTNLAHPAWQVITNVPTSVAGTNTLTNSLPSPSQFFRLSQSFAVENLDQPSSDWDGPIGSDNNSNDYFIGQEFALPAGNYALNKITLPLIPANGNASVTVSIWNTDSNNNPYTEIAVVSSQYVSSPGNVDFVPSTPIALPSGNYYVVAAPTTAADNAKVGWYWTASLAWTGFGTLDGIASTYFGSWANEPISEGPYQMGVQVTPVLP